MNMDINSMDNKTNETNRVDIKKIEERLKESFSANPIFDPNNVGKDNSVEDKIVSYVMKLSETVNINMDSFYERMKSLKLEPLSIYANCATKPATMEPPWRTCIITDSDGRTISGNMGISSV